MKFLTALFALVVGVSIARAANPAYQSFDSNQFSYTSGHIWIKNGAKLTNLVILGNVTLNGTAISAWPAGGTNATNFDILDVGTIFVTNGITLGGTTATNWVWVNNSGTIEPAPNQTTNTLSFTSGLTDNTNNIGQVFDTANLWTAYDSSGAFPVYGILQAWRNKGTNAAHITSWGALEIGKTVVEAWFPDPGDSFISVHNVDVGESANNYFNLESVSDVTLAGGADIKMATVYDSTLLNLKSSLEMDTHGTNGVEGQILLRSSPTNSFITISPVTSGPNRLALGPGQPPGSPAYIFDTHNVYSASDVLLQIANQGTNIVTVDGAGNVSAAGTVSASLLYSTNNATVGGLVVTTNAAFGGQSGYTGYTTANLPAGVAVGYQTYCTDCLTPWGTGDRVEWDGAAWRTLRQRVLATTNHLTYILSCTAGATYIDTALSDIGFSPEFNGVVWNIARSTAGTISASSGPAETIGTMATYSTGATTNGVARSFGYYVPTNIVGGFYACGSAINIINVPDGTDNYWVKCGFDTGAGMPTDGAYFLYDRYNAAARGSPGAETNHWLCVTAKASAYTYADSGLTPSVTSAMDRLAVIMTTTAVYFYTNGVVCATNTLNIPVIASYANNVAIAKTAGTTARVIREANPWYHIRRAAARAY